MSKFGAFKTQKLISIHKVEATLDRWKMKAQLLFRLNKSYNSEASSLKTKLKNSHFSSFKFKNEAFKLY